MKTIKSFIFPNSETRILHHYLPYFVGFKNVILKKLCALLLISLGENLYFDI